MQPDAARVLMALHGYDEDAEQFATALAPVTRARRWRVLAPSGPVVTRSGTAWFASLDDEPGPPLAATLGDLETRVADACAVAAVDPQDALTVLGWSQGAATALAFALRAGARVRPATVIALAAWLPNEPDVAWDLTGAAAAGVRVVLVHGIDDPVVPVEQGRGAYRALDRAGLDVTWVEVEAGHTLDALLSRVPVWLDT